LVFFDAIIERQSETLRRDRSQDSEGENEIQTQFQMTENSRDSQSNTGKNWVNAIGERGWVWLLCLVCLVIVSCSLGSSALFEPDEGRNAEKAREILLLGDWVTPHENFLPTLDKPIFFYWLVAISFKLFGLSEWSARLPSALAALGCIVLVYRFARLQWGVRDALWSSLILVTSLEFVLFSRLVIFDMTLTFFIALGLFSFYAATETDNLRSGKIHCLIMHAAMAIGTLVKGPIASVVPGMVIFCYLLLTRKWFLLRRLNILLGILVYFMIVAPWYGWAESRNPGYLWYFLWEEHFIRYVTPHFGRAKGWYYYFLVLGVGFLPWSFFIPLVVRNLWKRTFTDAKLFLVLCTILPFAFFSASNAKLPHYILPIYPALAILTGQALVDRIRETATKRSRIIYIPGIFIVAFIGYLLIGATWPNLLASEIRSVVTQSFSVLLLFGAMIVAIFGVYVIGDLRNLWIDQGAAFMSTAASLTLFMILTGQIITAASIDRAAKSIAQATAPLMGQEDRLVFYDNYIEGLPFYLRLNKPIWLVQSRQKKELMGSIYVAEKRPTPAPGYGQILFTFEEFIAEWKKNELPLRIFVKEKSLPRLTRELGEVPKSLMRFGDVVLVSNR
jgi:4-amino-4-deoxy-L-arabinose transferase-like glycosyltransferase